ncbi:MAG: chemotaxis-specific protein-glutamate methyltransferase CheB [Bacteroidales bacterium]
MIRKKIKVLIVDDSLVTQKLLRTIVNGDDRFELTDIAENGKQAIEMIKKHQPDVVSMDIVMPIMDGIEATRIIMQENPLPVIIVSSLYQTSEIEMAMKVLEAGAVAILPRPQGPEHIKHQQTVQQYLNMLQLMSEVKVVRRKKEITTPLIKNSKIYNPSEQKNTDNRSFQVLAIGASAGGPEGIRTILSDLPADFQLPVFIVQHIDPHFAEGFAVWLNSYSKINVSIAINGEKIIPGNAYLPPGDHHMFINKNNTIAITKDLPVKGLRPSVDLLFKSIANTYGKNSIIVLLSGMGKDGAVELKNLFDLGAYTIAQEETSCLVFGMPGEAVKLGGVCKLLSPENIIKEINNIIRL